MTEIQRDRIAVLNYIMTCVIVLFHCDLKKGDIISLAISTFATMAMCFFFWVTGCLLFRNLSFDNYFRKIKSRVMSLLVPYLLWQVAFWLKDIVLGGGVSFLDLLRAVFLLIGKLPDGALWYVYIVFLLAVVASPILLVVFKFRRIADIILFLCIPVAVLILNRTNNTALGGSEYAWLRRTIGYYGAYYYGAYFGYYVKNKSESEKETIGKIALCIVVCYLLNPFVPGALNSSVVCGMPLLLILFTPLYVIIKKWKIYNLSFLIYAIHQPIVQVLRKRVDYFATNVVSNVIFQSVIYYSTCLVIVVIIAWMMYYVLRSFSPKLLKVLTGDRVK